MRLVFIKHLRDRLTFIRRQRRHVHQPFNPLIVHRGDDGSGICMASQQNRALRPCESTIQRSGVITKRRQRNWRGHHIQARPFQRENDAAPARPIRPGSMHQNRRCIGLKVHGVFLGKELLDVIGNERAVVFQREMPGLDQVKLRLG